MSEPPDTRRGPAWLPYLLVVAASSAAWVGPAPLAAKLGAAALSLGAGLAGARAWHPRAAWVPSLLLAAGPTATLLDPQRAIMAAIVLPATAWLPVARAAPGLLASLAWPPLGMLGAAHLPPRLLPLALVPAAAAVYHTGSWLLAGPYVAAVFLVPALQVLRWLPATPESVRSILHVNLLGAGLLLIAATLLADQLPEVATPAKGVLQALALAVLVGLAVAQGGAIAIAHRAGDPHALAWPAAGLGTLVLAAATLLSVNLRGDQALGLAVAVSSVQLTAVAALNQKQQPAAWFATIFALTILGATAAHWLPGAG